MRDLPARAARRSAIRGGSVDWLKRRVLAGPHDQRALRVRSRRLRIGQPGGDELRARRVASSVDCRLTFETFLDAGQLPPDFLAEIGRIDYGDFSSLSSLAKLRVLALRRRTAYTPNADACGACGLCVVACPEGAITLAKAAHDNQWPILSFSHPVRAHDRSKSHTPFLVSALIIGVAAVLGRFQYLRR